MHSHRLAHSAAEYPERLLRESLHERLDLQLAVVRLWLDLASARERIDVSSKLGGDSAYLLVRVS